MPKYFLNRGKKCRICGHNARVKGLCMLCYQRLYTGTKLGKSINIG